MGMKRKTDYKDIVLMARSTESVEKKTFATTGGHLTGSIQVGGFTSEMLDLEVDSVIKNSEKKRIVVSDMKSPSKAK